MEGNHKKVLQNFSESFHVSKNNENSQEFTKREISEFNPAPKFSKSNFRKSITMDKDGKLSKEKKKKTTQGNVSPKKVFSFTFKKSKKEQKPIDVFGEKAFSEIYVKNKRIHDFHQSFFVQAFVNISTVYVLFADDFRTVCCTKNTDDVFDSLIVFFIFVFAFDIIMSFLAYKDYSFSFFFWLDIISTLSLITDLQWVQNSISVNATVANTTQISRASRASRIGTRAGRLIRLVRLVKLYKSFSLKTRLTDLKEAIRKLMNKTSTFVKRISQYFSVSKVSDSNLSRNRSGSVSSISENIQSVSNLDKSSTKSEIFDKKGSKRGSFLMISEKEFTKESRVGRKISELTTKRVIILVLVMIVVLPWLSSAFWYDDVLSYEIGVEELIAFSTLLVQKNTNFSLDDLNDVLMKFVEEGNQARYPLIFVNCPLLNFTYYGSTSKDELRLNEIQEFSLFFPQNNGNVEIKALINVKPQNVVDSIINIVRTIYISIILVIGALFFSKDVNDLCLRPIERMIEKVNQIAKNPLSIPVDTFSTESQNLKFETAIIENAILKIAKLLALGFGEAGGEIIAQNIAKGGDVNPMISGTKKFAIFGFCDIRNFTDTTEVLQEEVMTFVNRIGDVVHRTVEKYGGSANKNIGDAFLLVWKIPEEQVYVDENDNVSRNPYIKNLCDLALISFLKIIIKINFKPNITKYRNNKKLALRIPKYSVKMGFGLHMGWAIEGAIGSHYKIDASYLSPNVNIASRLESATKQYGVVLLFSDKLYSNLSNKMRKLSRQVDKITVKGSKEPMAIFTCDLNLSGIPPSLSKANKQVTQDDIKAKRQEITSRFLNGNEKANSLVSVKSSLLTAIMNRNEEFFKNFNVGVRAYLSGNWQVSREKLKLCQNIFPNDGPTLTLLNYMKSFQFLAPLAWSGFRELLDK